MRLISPCLRARRATGAGIVLASLLAATPLFAEEGGPSKGGVAIEPIPVAGAKPAEVYGPPAAAPKASAKEPVVAWDGAPSEAPDALTDAVRIATRTYPTALAAKSQLRAAASDVRSAQWQRLPSLSAEASLVDNSNSYNPSVTVGMPVWSGGRIGATVKRAKAFETAAQSRYRETLVSLALNANQLYFEIIRLTRREALVQQSFEEHGKLVEAMERRVAQEVSPLADLELARSRYAQIEQELTIVRSQRLAALRSFAELVGDPAYKLGPMPAYAAGQGVISRESLPDEAIDYDPARRRLMAEAEAARAEVAANKAALFPRLDAQYSYSDLYGSRVGVVAKVQTTGGLSQFSAISGARSRLDTALQQILAQERFIRQQISNDLVENDAARSRAAVSENASLTAQRVSESYMRQFIAGRRSWLDVMNALRESLSAQLGQTDAEITAMASAVRISLRSGRWQPFSETEAD